METCLFAENFWGEKHAGFDILYQNLKLDYRSISDLVDFLRESGSAEDAFSKSLSKISKQTSSNTTVSVFKPCWSMVHRLVESMAQFHQSLAQAQLSLMKDVQRYMDEQQKRHKSVRESEASTQEVVHAFQVSAVQLHRAKEVYHSRLTEYQRVTRNDSVSTRDQEKAETKLKKALDEYRYSVEKYNNLRTQFVNKMHSSCAQFQEVEASYLDQMCEFLRRYHSIMEPSGLTVQQYLSEFKSSLESITTEQLLQTFVKERGTGSNEPPTVTLEDVEVAEAFAHTSSDRVGMVPTSNSVTTFAGREQRAASALAVAGDISPASLTDFNGEENSTRNAPQNLTSNTPSSTGSSKRRDGFFRRRRNSLNQDVQGVTAASSNVVGTPSETTTSPLQSSSSLSAFSIVAKRGLRRLGTPNSNGKEKQGSKVDVKSAEDWRTSNTPAELPKDEEGYSIRPSDPWSEGDDHSDSGSDTEVDIVGRSFKGLKVNIRPVGDFAPGVKTLQTEGAQRNPKLTGILSPPPSNRPVPPVLHDSRSARGGKHESFSRSTNLSEKSGQNANLIQQLPTAPALPPPPSLSLLGLPNHLGKSLDDSSVAQGQTTDSSRPTVSRPRWPSNQTWSKGTLSRAMQRLRKANPVTLPGFLRTAAGSSNAHQPAFVGLDLTTFDILTSEEAERQGAIPDSGPNDRRNVAASLPNGASLFQEDQTSWFSFDSESSTTLCDQPPANQADSEWPTQSDELENITSEPTTPTPPEPPPRTHSKVASDASSLHSLGMHHSISGSSGSLSSPKPFSLAAAFTETWRAHFLNGGGSSFSTIMPPPVQTVTGQLTLAFPTSAVKQMIAAPTISPLTLKLKHALRLSDINLQLEGTTLTSSSENGSAFPDNQQVSDSYTVTVPGSAMVRSLTEQLETRSSADRHSGSPDSSNSPAYVKLDLLSYTVSLSAFERLPTVPPPILLCTYWRCEPGATDFRLDYTTHWPLDNHTASDPADRGDLRVHLRVDGGVTRMQSLPMGYWFPEANRATWQIPLTPPPYPNSQLNGPSLSGGNASGTIRAKFMLSSGPGRPQPVALQFFREGCLASGVKLEVQDANYQLNLCKQRVLGDRYICDPPSHSPRFQLHPAHTTNKLSDQKPQPPSRIPLPQSGALPNSSSDATSTISASESIDT